MLMRKIEAAAKFVPMENLSICPNCGFSGASADAWIAEDIAAAQARCPGRDRASGLGLAVERQLPGLERRLKVELPGGVDFSRFTRGRYATDASHYQIMPLGVVTPRTIEEAERAIGICRAEGVPVTPRGGGSSQAGQTVNSSVIVDCSKHLNRILDLDVAGRRARVEPGIVLDDLNRALKPHGLWFPVDVSTALARHHRRHDGEQLLRRTLAPLRQHPRECHLHRRPAGRRRPRAHFGPVAADLSDMPANSALRPLARDLFALGAREADEIAARFPKVQRRVGGYNIDALVPGRNDVNLAHILVGSEGTLAFSTAIEIKLSPVLGRRAVGACHFGGFHEAMAAAQHIVKLGPIAVELVDSTMIGLARDIAMFRPTLEAFVRGAPAALLLVEFAEEPDENERRLKRLHDLIGDLGFDWRHSGANWGGVVDVLDPKLQGRDHRAANRRPQHHDVDEGGGQADLLRRGLRGAARASRRLHRAADRRVREERHQRHLVRACLGRLPACAADPEFAARQGRQGDARHRRAGFRLRA